MTGFVDHRLIVLWQRVWQRSHAISVTVCFGFPGGRSRGLCSRTLPQGMGLVWQRSSVGPVASAP
ncbi:hypothetical protein FRAHR75_510059 [Frankia sp. Hr75.2]|nr:hypothetical protein FRAHR75_510059 [Frankia sp. Hr75.2]